jgi:hypothetical protein
MAVSGRVDGYACRKIEKLVAIHIFDPATKATLDDEWIASGVTRRHQLLIRAYHLARPGAGQPRSDLWSEPGVRFSARDPQGFLHQSCHRKTLFQVSRQCTIALPAEADAETFPKWQERYQASDRAGEGGVWSARDD